MLKLSPHLLILCDGATNKAGKSQGKNDQKSPLTNCGSCLLNLDKKYYIFDLSLIK